MSPELTATEIHGINPDKAEEVGMEIQTQLEGLKVVEASIKKSDHIKL